MPKGKLHFFMLNETRSYMAQKVGDILSALQTLHDDSANLGSRQLNRAATGVANQIRLIIHDSWPDTELMTLKTLQKIAVALLKAIDSNADVRDVLGSAVQELQTVTQKLKVPVNGLSSNEDATD